MKIQVTWMIVCAAVLAAACDDGNGDDGSAGLSQQILGDYTDDWGTSYSFTEDEVVVVFPPFDTDGEPTTVSADITEWYADDEYLITDNLDGTFGRYDWTFVGDDLYICQIEYAASSAEIAAANESADRAEPAASGCGDYSWSMLTPAQ